jgi:hypothetical protein
VKQQQAEDLTAARESKVAAAKPDSTAVEADVDPVARSSAPGGHANQFENVLPHQPASSPGESQTVVLSPATSKDTGELEHPEGENAADQTRQICNP